MKLGRSVKSSKTKYYVNDVPCKEKEYKPVVEEFGTKDFFLSLFNTQFFPSLHWETQRSMLLQYVTAPSNKQVFNAMSRTSKDQLVKDITLNPQAEKLSELVKKHSLDDLQKIHRENKTKMEKAYIAGQSRTKTLQEQLDQVKPTDISEEEIQKELDSLGDQIEEIKKNIDSANSSNREYDRLYFANEN